MQILVIILATAVSIVAGSFAVHSNPSMLFLILIGGLVGTFAFSSPKVSLILMVLSMLLSPKLGMGDVSSYRTVVLRYDDILLVIIFMSWFARTAIFKDKPFITSTPVQTPVLLYTSLCVISTAFGVMRGDVEWKMASFYVLKYVEYFLLYFMTVNIVDSAEEVKKYMRYGLFVAIAVTIYAYWYYNASGGLRATAPFETPLGADLRESEPASLGGYFLVIFGILFAFLTESGGTTFLLTLGLILFIFPPFLFTFSRSSYLAFAAMLPVLFFFTRKRRLFLIGFITAGFIALTLFPTISSKVVNRITMTYSGGAATQSFNTGTIGAVKLEDSAAARVNSLHRVLFEQLPQHPIIGWGVTAVGLCDTQYALVLGETGLLGFLLFGWMLYRLFYTARIVFHVYKDSAIRALALGFMVSLLALLVQCVGVNSFVIVRIMEPFWFIAACLSVLYLKIDKADSSIPVEVVQEIPEK